MNLSRSQGNDQEVYVGLGARATLEKIEGSESSRGTGIAPHLLIVSTFGASFLPSSLLRCWSDLSLIPFVVRVIRIHWPSLSLVVSLPLLSEKKREVKNHARS